MQELCIYWVWIKWDFPRRNPWQRIAFKSVKTDSLEIYHQYFKMNVFKKGISFKSILEVDHTWMCKNGCLTVWILSVHQIRGFHTLAVTGGLASRYEVGSCRSSWRRWVAIMKVVHMHALCKDKKWSCFHDNFSVNTWLSIREGY